MKLASKRVLVTGGGSGLGKSMAELMSEKGAEVHVCGRREPKSSSEKLIFHACDISKYKQIKDLIKSIGDIDVLVNAAGIWLGGDTAEYSQKQIDNVIDINLKGLIYTSQAVLPSMLQAGEGVIVNISSTSGMKPRSKETIYAASKWGVRGFTDSLREEAKADGVRVLGAYPGGMATPFYVNANKELDNNDWMNPDEVARIIVQAVENDESLSVDEIVMNRKVV